MKRLLVLFLLILGACDSAPKCDGFQLLEWNESTARILSPDDKYYNLFRTESECGYRYLLDREDVYIVLWDNCNDDWTVLLGEESHKICK
ncbi:hypothetical protein LJC18_04505 [Lachnospiraceae bacterium OttesenSCG-928-E19]|nr:hypothetical protein [Lachnospiraceae bacterium OttesenSCG-928-E19]